MEANSPPSPILQQEASNEKTSGARLEELASESAQLAQLVASNPSAPPALLRLLAGCRDAPTRRNVAANPNTPTEVLLHLGAEFPEELLANPVFSLLLLENPRLLQEMPPATLASLVQLETVPVFFFEPAAKRSDKEILLALAKNPKTPWLILTDMADIRDEIIGPAARLHIEVSGEIAPGWEAATRQKICKIYLGQIKPISETAGAVYKEGIEILEYLGGLPEQFKSLPDIVRRFPSIGTNPNTPVSVLRELALDRNSQVRSWVAKNLNTPVSLLEQLAKDSDSWVRKKVAANPKTPVRQLVKLATDIYSCVVREVAANPQTPASLLVGLAKDNYARVSKEMAANPNTPVSILELLAKESVVKLRQRVAFNPNTSASLLAQLALDSDLEVRRQVAKNPNTPASVLVELAKSNSTILKEVASNPNTPVSLLEQFVKDKDSPLRPEVASNPNTPVSLLVELALDSDWWVCQKVASNPNTPISLFEWLIKDNNWSYCEKVASNPNTPASVLKQLLGNLDEIILHMAVGRYLAKNPDGLSVVLQHYPKDSSHRYSRLFILLHPQVPSHVLAEHSRSLWWWERYALTQHPNTPPDALKRLAGDANRLVRAAARANLQNRQIEA